MLTAFFSIGLSNLRVAELQVGVASYKLRDGVPGEGLRVEVASCELRVVNWSCELHAACTVGVANNELRVNMTRCELEMLFTSSLVCPDFARGIFVPSRQQPTPGSPRMRAR